MYVASQGKGITLDQAISRQAVVISHYHDLVKITVEYIHLLSKHSRKTTVSVSQIVIEQKVFCFLNTKKILILFILKYYTTQVVISVTAADAGFG